MEQKQLKVRTALTNLEVGETVSFPIDKTKGVRSQASDLGIILDRVYSTATNRQERTITVTRKA